MTTHQTPQFVLTEKQRTAGLRRLTEIAEQHAAI